MVTVVGDTRFHFISLGMDTPMVITDPIETQVQSVFRGVLGPVCSDKSKTSLVLDFGMNMGYYSLFSAALGCRVATAEPQELCHALMNVSLVVNGFENLVRRYRNILWPEPRTVDTPFGGCDGGFQATPQTGSTVSSITLTSIIENAGPIDRLPLMKVDVEGAEVGVLISGQEHIWGPKEPKIENIIIELVPSRWSDVGTTMDLGKQTFKKMVDAGYQAYQINGGGSVIDGVPAQAIPDMESFISGNTQGQNVWFRREKKPV